MPDNKYGVRIYPISGSKMIRVKQTVKSPKTGDYVIDTMKDGDHREKHVSLDDTVAIADAVRQALRGTLKRG